MLSQNINSSYWKLHDDLFEATESLFLRLAVVEWTNVKIKNNLPELSRILFKNKKVKIWKDLLPIANIIIQIRDDGYDIGSVITIIWKAYNSAVNKSIPKYSKRKVPNFADDIAKLFGDDFIGGLNSDIFDSLWKK